MRVKVLALLVGLLVLVLAAVVADSGWKIQSTSARLELGHGAWQVSRRVAGPAGVNMDLVFFEDGPCLPRVVSNPTRKDAESISQAAARVGAIAGCNGGYFEPGNRFAPAGMEIAAGQRTGTVEAANPLGGALVVRDGKAALVWDAEFRDGPTITDYVHCNPWLVSDGKAWIPAEPGRKDVRANRSFIATDERGHWVMGTTGPVGLEELARLLITPGIITEFPVRRALNLDGGPSATLWWRDAAGAEHEKKAAWAVRNFVFVVPRAAESTSK